MEKEKMRLIIMYVECTLKVLKDNIDLLERQKKNRKTDMEKLHAYQDGWQAALEMAVRMLEKDLNIRGDYHEKI